MVIRELEPKYTLEEFLEEEKEAEYSLEYEIDISMLNHLVQYSIISL